MFMKKFIFTYVLSLVFTLVIGTNVYVSSGSETIQLLGNILIFFGVFLGLGTACTTALRFPTTKGKKILLTIAMLLGTLASVVATALIL
jgi:hypothetical protein